VVTAYFVGYYFVRRIDSTGSVERLSDSDRRRSVRTDSNIESVNNLILSHEGQPGTSKSPQEIKRETGISHYSVVRIAKHDLRSSNSVSTP